MRDQRQPFHQQSDSSSGAFSYTVTKANQINAIHFTIDVQPITSESLTITLNATAGSSHLIYSTNPSEASGSGFDLYWDLEPFLSLAEGDTVVITFPNSDANTCELAVNYVPF